MKLPALCVSGLLIGGALTAPVAGQATTWSASQPGDRDPGTATTLSGVYVARGELRAFLSYERVTNHGFEYSPNELGVPSGADYQGDLRASQGVIFLGYGLTDAISFGLEASIARVTLRKADDDTSALPDETRQSGLGGVHVEGTWRFLDESAGRPELFTFVEVQLPHDRSKRLTGTENYVILPGIGLSRGFGWGRLIARVSIEYDTGSESALDFGEWSVEAYRVLSSAWRLSAGLEGQIGGSNNLDEVWLISDLDWKLGDRLALRFHNGLGLTAKTAGWSPEVGLLIRF